MDEATLCSMFAEQSVRRAVALSNGDVEMALELLLAGEDLIRVDDSVRVSEKENHRERKVGGELAGSFPELSAATPPPPKPRGSGFGRKAAPTKAGSSSSSSAVAATQGAGYPPTPPVAAVSDIEQLLLVLEAQGLSRQNTALDPDMLEYLVEMLAASIEEDESLALLQQFIPDLGDDPSSPAAKAILAHLCSLAAAKRTKQQAASTPPPSSSSSKKVDEILFEIHQGHMRARDPVCTRDVASVMEAICDDQPELMIYVTEDIAEFVYLYVAERRGVRETVAYLKTNCNSDEGREEIEGRMELRRRKEEEEEERKRNNRRLVVEKFDEVEVRPKYDSKGNAVGPKKELVVFLDRAISDGKCTRFRDGVAVVHDGRKFIIEKNPSDDYDGGSRGKVKSKGKRGPGWTA